MCKTAVNVAKWSINSISGKSDREREREREKEKEVEANGSRNYH